MAKFGQGFLTSLTRPSYLDSLGKTGMMIGQMPGQVMKDRRERELMEQFANADPYDQAQILKTKAIQNKDYGLLTQAQQMETNWKQNNTKFASNQLLTLLENPKTTDAQAQAIKSQLVQDASLAGLDPARVKQAIAAADKKRVTGVAVAEQTRVNAATVRAGQMVAAGQTREAFDETYPDLGYVWDEAQQQKSDKDYTEVQAGGMRGINAMKGLIAKETDSERILAIQKNLEETARRTGNFGPDIVGLGDQRIRQLEQARIDAADRQQTEIEERRENMVTGLVNGMFESGLSVVPKYVTDSQGNSVPIPEDIRSDVTERYNSEKKERDALEEARQQGILPSNYIDIVNNIMENNPEFIENAPKFDASLQILKNNKPPEGQEPSKIYKNAAEYVAKTVNAYQKQQRITNLKEPVIRRRVEKMMGEYVANVSTGAPSDWGGADLVYTILTDPDYADEKELLTKNMIIEIQQAQGGKIPWRELVDRASDGEPRLQRLMGGEQKQRAAENRASKQQQELQDAYKEALVKIAGEKDEYTAGEHAQAKAFVDNLRGEMAARKADYSRFQ